MDLSLFVLCLCLFNGVFGVKVEDHPDVEHSNNTEMNYPEHNTEFTHSENITLKHSENDTKTELPEVNINNFLDIDLNNAYIHNGQSIKQMRVMEGDNVTLGSASRMKGNPQIKWTFTPQHLNTTSGRNFSVEQFGDRLHVDPQTGSLTIRNIRTTDSGLYHQNSSTETLVRTQRFNITASLYSSSKDLPTPTITGPINCSSSSEGPSSYKCVVLCSVNVTNVSLSWYNGSYSLSSISVSDVNISLALSLEDTNTYTCVVSNLVSNQTKHVNIAQHCHKCSKPTPLHPLLVSLAAILGLLLGMCICCCEAKRRRTILIFR